MNIIDEQEKIEDEFDIYRYYNIVELLQVFSTKTIMIRGV